MTRRIAVAGWFGAGNLGDELILRALAGRLRASGAEPVAISIDPDRTELVHGIAAVSHRSPLETPGLRRRMAEMDGMVVAGGLIQTETSMWNVPFHSLRMRAAGRLPASAVGLGVGRVGGFLARRIARYTLGRLRSVVVRDHDSADRLREWGLRNVRVGSDPVIGARVEPAAPRDELCVVLRPPNRPGIGTAASKVGRARPGEARGLAAAVDAVAGATGLPVRMVAFQASRDTPVHHSVAERIDAPVDLVTPGLDTVLQEVGRSRLVITMRYHGAIAALLHGRPAILLDYSPKMASLAAEGGRWAPLVTPERPAPDRMVRAAQTALAVASRSGEAREALRRRLVENDRALDEVLA